jgi:predicted XRE-type DNA-binding protein
MRKNGSMGSEIFEDLGFSHQEAQHLHVRAQLMSALREAIRKRRLSQVAAAKLLGTTQPRVSNLLRGRIDLFSTDALIELLSKVGIGVRLTLKPLPRPGRAA